MRNLTKNDKMLNYLFYKIYRAALQGSLHDVPKSAAAITVAILININLLTLNLILAKLNIIDFLYSEKRVVIFIAIALIVLMTAYFNNGRVNKIILQYSMERGRSRIVENGLVIAYIILSVALLFLVPLVSSKNF